MQKVSIIVPIYNAEESLEKCLKSISRQSYHNWELLLVDDGSIDDTRKICETFSMHDARIRYFHKNNGGVSSARNYGIEKSNGDRIVFVDSDDYVDSLWLEHLIGEEDVDLVVCGYAFHNGNTIIKRIPSDVGSVTALIGELGSAHDLGCVCRFCFRKSIIQKHHIRFNEQYFVLEDECFLSNYIRFSEKVQVKSVCDYHSPFRDYEKKYQDKWNDDVYFEIADNIFHCFEKDANCYNSRIINDKIIAVKRYYLAAMYNSFVREMKRNNRLKAIEYYKKLTEYSHYWLIYPRVIMFKKWMKPLIYVLKSWC